MEFSNESTAQTAIVDWRRFPRRPTWAPPLNYSFTNHSLGNIVTVDLVIRNVTREFDAADYTILVGDCLTPCANISLKVRDKCHTKPQPTAQRNVTVTAYISDSYVTLPANFTGDESLVNYPVVFSTGTVSDLLNHETLRNKYSIKCRVYSNCDFSVELVIWNLTMEDAGVYVAQAEGLKFGSREIFFHLEILDRGSDVDIALLVAVGASAAVVVLGILGGCVCCLCRKRKKVLSNCQGQYTHTHACMQHVHTALSCRILPVCMVCGIYSHFQDPFPTLWSIL